MDMDPNAALKEIRELTQSLKNAADEEYGFEVGDEDNVSRLCDLIDGLDNWLKMGGFLPKDWERRS